MSSVHGFASLHSLAGPEMHAPLEQLSFKVHGFPSSQAPSKGLLIQPPPPVQISTVQGLLSSQERSPLPPQAPSEQTSPVVHAFLSSQARVLLVCVQPVAGLQASVVQGFPSSHGRMPGPAQLPPEHMSPVVQRSPSLHGLLFEALKHPVSGLHESDVQTLESSQANSPVPPQRPVSQMSPVVHGFPSSHINVLA